MKAIFYRPFFLFRVPFPFRRQLRKNTKTVANIFSHLKKKITDTERIEKYDV